LTRNLPATLVGLAVHSLVAATTADCTEEDKGDNHTGKLKIATNLIITTNSNKQ